MKIFGREKEEMEVGEKAREVVAVVDMQNDFVYPEYEWEGERKEGKLVVQDAKNIVDGMKEYLRRKRNGEVKIIYTADSHPPDAGEFEEWGKHCVKGSPGAGIIEELKPKEGEPVFEKNAYSPFDNENLEPYLRELGVEKVTIVGVATEVCVSEFAIPAMEKGFEVEIKRNLVRGIDREKAKEALEKFEGKGGKVV